MKWFSMWFCRHQYQKVGFVEAQKAGIRYSVRRYKCAKCGKEIWIDGRFDNMKG